jgi:hypothetical protein
MGDLVIWRFADLATEFGTSDPAPSTPHPLSTPHPAPTQHPAPTPYAYSTARVG